MMLPVQMPDAFIILLAIIDAHNQSILALREIDVQILDVGRRITATGDTTRHAIYPAIHTLPTELAWISRD